MNKKQCSVCKRDLNIIINKYGVVDIMKSESVYSENRCLQCFEDSFNNGFENESIESLLINSINK